MFFHLTGNGEICVGRNLEQDAIQMAEKQKTILETAFRIFSERTIESVTMTDIAKESGIGIATLYRYYSTKQKLVMAVNGEVWKKYSASWEFSTGPERYANRTAKEQFEYFLDSFIELYRKHSDILRFNHFFNVYIQNEDVSEDEMKSYINFIYSLRERFEHMYQKGQKDRTMCCDVPAEKIFSLSLHLMLAAVTRYAVGLVYDEDCDPEEELLIQKKMLMQEFTAS